MAPTGGADAGRDRPLLFLDVDGVLNLWRPAGATDRWAFPDGRLLVLPTGVAERLRRLAGLFDIVWATTWGADAPEVFGRLLGSGEEWRVLEFDDRKWPAILRAARSRRFAWVDDNAGTELSGRQLPVDVVVVEQAAGVFVRGGDPLRSVRGAVVVVDPGHGLDDAALDVLVEFAGVEAAPFPLH